MVYEAFVGEIPKGMQINHLDGDKLNNHISNLEICTPSENVIHAYKTGLAVGQSGEKQGSSKLKEVDVLHIYDLIKKGYTNNQISSIFSVYSGHISSIRTGVRWKYLFEREGMRIYNSIGNIPHTFPECVYIYRTCRETKTPQVKLGKELGIDPSSVSRIRNGKLWSKMEIYLGGNK